MKLVLKFIEKINNGYSFKAHIENHGVVINSWSGYRKGTQNEIETYYKKNYFRRVSETVAINAKTYTINQSWGNKAY